MAEIREESKSTRRDLEKTRKKVTNKLSKMGFADSGNTLNKQPKAKGLGKTNKKCNVLLPGPRRTIKINKVAIKNHANNLELNSDYDSVYNYFNKDLNYSYKNRAYVNTIQIANIAGAHTPTSHKKTHRLIQQVNNRYYHYY